MRDVLAMGVLLLVSRQVIGDNSNCPYDGHLTAVKSWRITVFNQSLTDPYDYTFNREKDGMECSWQIEAESLDKTIRLRFPTFHLMNSTNQRREDCVLIYDGSDDTDELIQKLCERMPESVYNSTGRYLTVVFQQGGLAGRRWMTMNYTMEAPAPDEQNHFWSTTVGRILSFLIVIVIFGFFSFCFRSWREGRGGGGCLGDFLRGLCDRLSAVAAHCHKAVSDCTDRCTSLFKSQPQGRHGRGSVAAHPSESRSSTADIVTISGSGDGQRLSRHRSVLTDSGTDSSPEAELQSPPPDYSSIFSTPDAPPPSDGGGDGGAASVPVSAPLPSAPSAPPTEDAGSSLPPPPPPPLDNAAPPSYELPEPPSYDSLFNSSSHA